ncbi:uncharacterized protein LOC131663112 [Phymastichus coffea]|uniref:uncharacterized protein LOC131663112 n=1 Tax=Phymastichus coffea TaxID=108790 RepID=UPI00273CB204|nr:uncharacterized protein LOC131663112 [Phymastichus coffea]
MCGVFSRCDWQRFIFWRNAKTNRFKFRRPSFSYKFMLAVLVLCTFLFTVYLMSATALNYLYPDQLHQNFSFNGTSFETMKGYLVWNSKCHMLSMNPHDPSIKNFVKTEKFEPCSTKLRITKISRQANGSMFLRIDQDAAKSYGKWSCCWSIISRPKAMKELDYDIDSKISIGKCRNFEDRVLLDVSVEAVYTRCWTLRQGPYKNIHAVINPNRVDYRMHKRILPAELRPNKNSINRTTYRKPLSVLMLGLDSVSRLNFYRTMPATRAYFEDRGWTELRGYNKMGDNTFPNLMALLTGQNQTWAYAKCRPKALYGLDNCSMIWYNFREAGYATAYAEDHAQISTFNYLKVGFVKPPTDYYLRPYILASEKLLPGRQRFYTQYCTGPELSVDRIFNAALDFSEAFVGRPSFGFFWSNTISHETVNGPSLYDARFLAKLRAMEDAGVMNDSMIVMLSDHGMRYGDIRDTFVGWYEERLPFVYIWLPEWFREQNPESSQALRVNQNRLSSPYDLYETLRDVLQRAGGQAPASTGCPRCSSLMKPLPRERGCKEAGIAPHWCTCAAFEPISSSDSVVVEGANKFVDHMENIVKQYKNKNGNRVCSQPRLKRIIRVKKMLDLEGDPQGKTLKLFYLLEVTPGGGKFETTMTYNGPGNYTIRDEEVSRINLYGHSAKCLREGFKQYCHCGSWYNIVDFLFG